MAAAMVMPLRRFLELLQQVLSRSTARSDADGSGSSGGSSSSSAPTSPSNPLASEYGAILSIMLQAMQPPVCAITHAKLRDGSDIEPRQETHKHTLLQSRMEQAILTRLLTIRICASTVLPAFRFVAELMSDLATTLQRVLRWKTEGADVIEARAAITATIGQFRRGIAER